METRRRDSKSYLLRRELRQQKGVHSVSGRKAAIYTASILFPPVLPPRMSSSSHLVSPLPHCAVPLLCTSVSACTHV